MSIVTILGEPHEVRGLTALELAQWNSHLIKLLSKTYWNELYETIKTLPARLQEVIVAGSHVPGKLDKVRYFDLATRVESVRYLVSLIVNRGDGSVEIVVDERNAAEIFWDLQPFILNKPVILPGGEGLAKLREATQAEESALQSKEEILARQMEAAARSGRPRSEEKADAGLS